MRSARQVYLAALARTSPSRGPGLTATGDVPDLDHYEGSFGGRVYPLWADAEGSNPNVRPKLLRFLGERWGSTVAADAVMAYIAAAHPAFTARFRQDLSTPGLSAPLTAEAALLEEASRLGRRIIWLHTFGERMADPADDRPAGPPRVAHDRAP